MALYNQLFGENEDATAILGFAGLTREMFPRYRDVFLADEGRTVIVYTRIGGTNREAYEDEIKTIIGHPQYKDNCDDKKDNTYAYFKFNVFEKYLDTTKKMFVKEPIPVFEMFENHIKKAEDPNSEEYKKDMMIAEQIMRAIEEQPNGGCIFM